MAMLSLIVLLHAPLPRAAQAAEIVVPKDQFVQELKNRIPGAFCDEKTYFRKCFSANEEACKKSMSDAAAACLGEVQAQMPAQFHQPKDGGVWGEKVGTCVGARFEKEVGKLKLTAADCKDPAKWK